MLSFNSPCLRWKLILATKLQAGWPGFTAPYLTRYLNKLVVITTQPSYNYPNNTPTVRQQEWITDRLSGGIYSADGNDNANADFPYGATLNQNPPDETWEVTETYFKHVVNNGYFVIQTEITLSNSYDLATLDADANALLSSVSVAQMPWNTLQVAVGSDEGLPIGPYTPVGDLTALLPPQTIYDLSGAPGPIAVPQLHAAAWYVYAPGLVSSQNFFPNGYSKLIGYIAMAGNYCQKNFFIDYDQNVLDQTCQNGVGSCSNPFKITPPPLVVGRDTYVLVMPNCRCGS
jgi:hypothetical protein